MQNIKNLKDLRKYFVIDEEMEKELKRNKVISKIGRLNRDYRFYVDDNNKIVEFYRIDDDKHIKHITNYYENEIIEFLKTIISELIGIENCESKISKELDFNIIAPTMKLVCDLHNITNHTLTFLENKYGNDVTTEELKIRGIIVDDLLEQND